MVGALGVVVNNASDRRLLVRTSAWMAAGLFGGSLLIGTLLISFGAMMPGPLVQPVLMSLASLSLIWALAQVVIGVRPLQSRWQVPETWRRQVPSDVLALTYGFLLGIGVITAVVTTAFWALVTLTPLVPPEVGLIGWIVYPLTRLTGFVVASLRRRSLDIVISQRGIRVASALGGLAGASVVLQLSSGL